MLPSVLEALLFSAPRPLPAKEILSLLKSAAEYDPENGDSAALAGLREGEIHAGLVQLQAKMREEARAIRVTETASGWQLESAPEFGLWVRQLFPGERPARLSPAALETLAIIAYRQPIMRSEIEAVRGVAVDSIVQTLQERSLIKIVGRSELPGRPLLYGTTQFFMDHFGIRDLAELPNAAELKRVSLKPTEAGAPKDLEPDTSAAAPATVAEVEPPAAPAGPAESETSAAKGA